MWTSEPIESIKPVDTSLHQILRIVHIDVHGPGCGRNRSSSMQSSGWKSGLLHSQKLAVMAPTQSSGRAQIQPTSSPCLHKKRTRSLLTTTVKYIVSPISFQNLPQPLHTLSLKWLAAHLVTTLRRGCCGADIVARKQRGDLKVTEQASELPWQSTLKMESTPT